MTNLQDRATVTVEFRTEGDAQTLQTIQRVQESAIVRMNAAVGVIGGVRETIEQMAAALGGIFDALIVSNEKLNAQLLKSQTNLAGAFKMFRANGEEITDITEKIGASRAKLTESLKQIEKDTASLVGVTTSQVNGVFEILLANSSKFIGQSKKFIDPIDAATDATKNWAAALGTLGLPLEQANQEIRSILDGDVNNPDSTIAKTLQISKEQYTQWQANGELIDKINEKLSIYTEGNKLAAMSIEGQTSNLQSFFEDTARLVGQPLLEPVVKALSTIYAGLDKNRALIESLAKGQIKEIAEIFDTIGEQVVKFTDALDFDTSDVTAVNDTMISVLASVNSVIAVVGELFALIAPGLKDLTMNVVGLVGFAADGIKQLMDLVVPLIGVVNDALTSTKAFIDGMPGPLKDLTASISSPLEAVQRLQEAIGNVTGATRDSAEATKIYVEGTTSLIDQSAKLGKQAAEAVELQKNAAKEGAALSAQDQANVAKTSELVKNQIESLKSQKTELSELRTIRQEDTDAKAKAVAKLDEEIKKLSDASSQMDAYKNSIKLGAKDLADLGTAHDILKGKVEGAMRMIEAQGNGSVEAYEKAANAIADLTQKQIEFGQITDQEAKKRLNGVAQNTKLELETREKATDAIVKIEQDALKERMADHAIAVRKIEVAEATGQIGREERLKSLAAAEKTAADARVESIKKQIEATKAIGKDTGELEKELSSIQMEAIEKQATGIRELQDLKREVMEEAISKSSRDIESAETKRLQDVATALKEGVITQEAADAQRTASTTKRIEDEIALEKKKIAAIEAIKPANREDAAKQRKEVEELQNSIAKKQLELTDQQIQAEKKLGEELVKQQEARVKQLELKQSGESVERSKEELELVQKLAQGTLTQQEYEKQLGQIKIQRINDELQAEQAKFAELEKTAGNDVDKQKQLMALRESMISKQKSLAEAQLAAEKQVTAEVKAQLDARMKQVDLKSATDSLASSKMELELITKMADGTITRQEYEKELGQIKMKRIADELAAEEAKLAILESMKSKDADAQKNIITAQEAIALKRVQLATMELDAQKKVTEELKKQKDAQIELKNAKTGLATSEAELALMKKLADGLIDQQEYEKQLRQLKLKRISDEIAAEQAKFAVLAAQKSGDVEVQRQMVAIQEAIVQKQIQIQQLRLEDNKLIKDGVNLTKKQAEEEKKLLDEVEKRLKLRSSETDLAYQKELAAINQLVESGAISYEAGEKRKEEANNARVQAEIAAETEKLNALELLQASGHDKRVEINEQQTKILTLQNSLHKEQKKEKEEQVKVEKEIGKQEEKRIKLIEQRKIIEQEITTIVALQNASYERAMQLQKSQFDLTKAQLGLETQRVDATNQLNDAAMGYAKELQEVQALIAKGEFKNDDEKKAALEKEANLRRALGELGVDSATTEKELQQKKNDLEVQRLNLKARASEMELEQQYAAIENDRVRLQLAYQQKLAAADMLDIESEMIEAQAELNRAKAIASEDKGQKAALLEAAEIQRRAAGKLKESSQMTRDAAAQELESQNKLLDSQKDQLDIQKQAKQEALLQEQALLKASQASKGQKSDVKFDVKLNVNMKAVEHAESEFRNNLEKMRKSAEEARDAIAKVEIKPVEFAEKAFTKSINRVRESVSEVQSEVKKLDEDTGKIAAGIRKEVSAKPLALKVEPLNISLKNIDNQAAKATKDLAKQLKDKKLEQGMAKSLKNMEGTLKKGMKVQIDSKVTTNFKVIGQGITVNEVDKKIESRKCGK